MPKIQFIMKAILFLLILPSIFLLSCRKDESLHTDPESKGNILMLKADGETLIGGIEFNLSEFESPSDELPITISANSNNNCIQSEIALEYGLNVDTLLHFSNNNLVKPKELLCPAYFDTTELSIDYSVNLFQFIGKDMLKIESSWEFVSNLELVIYYRKLNPTSKIAVFETSENEFNEELDISYPRKAYYFFFAK